MICIFVFLTFSFPFLPRVVLYKCRKRVYEYYDDCVYTGKIL